MMMITNKLYVQELHIKKITLLLWVIHQDNNLFNLKKIAVFYRASLPP